MTSVDRKLTFAWIGLIALTLISFAAAESLMGRRFAIVAIFAIAAIKGHLVASRFMEVGHALPHWRTLYRVWIVAVAILLAVGHLI
jgi:heme/copper-type cytochrome/quinol oxidase subunit 4